MYGMYIYIRLHIYIWGEKETKSFTFYKPTNTYDVYIYVYIYIHTHVCIYICHSYHGERQSGCDLLVWHGLAHLPRVGAGQAAHPLLQARRNVLMWGAS